MKSTFVFTIAGLILLFSLSFGDKILAHAESDPFGGQGGFDDFGVYHCPEVGWGPYSAKDLAMEEYASKVGGFNGGLETRPGFIEELNKDYVVEGKTVTELDQMVGCLHDVHGIDPDDVIKFSDKAQAILNYDYERLMEVAPNIANYAEVPEFPSTAILFITSTALLASVLFSKRFYLKS